MQRKVIFLLARASVLLWTWVVNSSLPLTERKGIFGRAALVPGPMMVSPAL